MVSLHNIKNNIAFYYMKMIKFNSMLNLILIRFICHHRSPNLSCIFYNVLLSLT